MDKTNNTFHLNYMGFKKYSQSIFIQEISIYNCRSYTIICLKATFFTWKLTYKFHTFRYQSSIISRISRWTLLSTSIIEQYIVIITSCTKLRIVKACFTIIGTHFALILFNIKSIVTFWFTDTFYLFIPVWNILYKKMYSFPFLKVLLICMKYK